MMHEAIYCYLLLVNAASFGLYGIDKWKAQHKRHRISEACLLWMAALGGSIGALLGIFLWRHKTLHSRFRYGVPTLLALQLLVYYLLTK